MLVAACLFSAEPVSGDAEIRAKFGSSEIVLTTTSRLAGAIHSLRWDNREFVDSFDHGRQLQSACSFGDGPRGFHAEGYNPTEAGSRNDGRGDKSSSRLLKLLAEKNELETVTQMAFWLAPGQTSEGKSARNDRVLSNHLLCKRVRIGVNNALANVIDYRVRFSIPEGERHRFAQFEAATCYMPADFSRFWRFASKSGELLTLDDGPGEQPLPIVFATENGSHAMGIWSPDQPSKGFEKAGYGRWRFKDAKVVKWNCVFRLMDANGVKPGDYSFQCYMAVGTIEDVRNAMRILTRPK